MHLVTPSNTANGSRRRLLVRLARQPSPTAMSVGELVVGSQLTLPIAAVGSVTGDETSTAEYFRSAEFTLLHGNARLCSVEDKGLSPTGVLATDLDRSTTFEMLQAVTGHPSALQIHVRLVHEKDGQCELEFFTSVHELFSDVRNLDEWVKLVAPDPRTGDIKPVPPLIQQQPTRDIFATRVLAAPAEKGFANITSVAAVSRLDVAKPNAFASHVAMLTDHRIRRWDIDDIIFPPANEQPHVPQMDQPDLPCWPDSVDPSRYWYMPMFDVVAPDPAQLASASPYLYRFQSSGHSVSGRPGIDATIVFTIRGTLGADTTHRLQELGNPPAKPVPFVNLAVTLSIPFRDEQGRTRREHFTATTETHGDTVVARVALLDDWARLAYGALAMEGFQAEPPRIRVDVGFQARVPMAAPKIPVVLASKFQRIQLLDSTPVRQSDSEVVLATSAGRISFMREANSSTRAAVKPFASQSLAIYGRLHSAVLASVVSERPLYGLQTVGRSQEFDCLFPCESLGALYVEVTTDGEVTIGCQDALKLAQTEYRQYTALNDPHITGKVQVWRSLSQPGRFLIVPRQYQITRFGPDAGDRAYRPAIFLYSLLDAEHPENNRCVLTASVGPDLAPHEVERLREVLRGYSPNPRLEYVTEIQADVTFTWSISNTEILRDKQAMRRWDGFQVTLTTDVTQVPLVETMLTSGGISIVAEFLLPDQTRLQSILTLDLNTVVGPFATGPIAARLEGARVELKNRIETETNVDDVLVVDDQAPPGTTSLTTTLVNRSLAPNETVAIQVNVPQHGRVVPVAASRVGQPAALSEIRSFVEDIYSEIAFVNLINYANHGLAAITIEARFRDVPGSHSITLSELEPVSMFELVLPLTKYLAHPVLEFQATVTKSDQSVQTSPWIMWPLETKGNVIGVTWDLLGVPS